MKSFTIKITGIVQGVGFRPFVFNLAKSLGIKGWVLNDSRGVLIEAEGDDAVVDEFLRRLRSDAPKAAEIENVETAEMEPRGYADFIIKKSEREIEKTAAISPDIATCPDCLADVADKGNRRFRYAFTNCTNCGPRLTIIKDVPYDRPNTTMAEFRMCPDCLREYEDPRDRRFHAQPNACPVCGPALALFDRDGKKHECRDAIAEAVQILKSGKILAVKGLGGYHLACDAENETATAALRSRKYREDKPFAVMVQDLAAAQRFAVISKKEKEILLSKERPIVILKKATHTPVAPSVAPRNRNIGIMLPYTPLHHLLINDFGGVLVMTSGNLSDEPISFQDGEAKTRLNKIYDFILTHDRGIETRCDDSVVRAAEGGIYFVRRSRGYAPRAVKIGRKLPKHVLAVGAMLKNTFAVAKNDRVYISHHIGDLENAETFAAFEKGIGHFKKMFDVSPEAVVHDLHPDYLSTKYALALEGVRKIPLQHHKAHVFSLKADAGILDRPIIGVSMDGTGYGEDGKIWGGEFFISDGGEMKRAGHLAYLPLPGGDAAVKEPWRMGVSALREAFGDSFLDLELEILKKHPKEKIMIIAEAVKKGINSPLCSSAGRLFDAVSAIAGVCYASNYEGQAAVEFEQAGDFSVPDSYEFEISKHDGMFILDPKPVIKGVVADMLGGTLVSLISGKFHNALASAVSETALALSKESGLKECGLSGGVFQNVTLLGKIVKLLEKAGLRVYIHRRVPPNDGGISLGQAAYSLWSE